MSLRSPFSKLKKKTRAFLSRGTPEPECNEVGSGRAEPANSHLQPNPRIGTAEEGKDVGPRIGEYDGMKAW